MKIRLALAAACLAALAAGMPGAVHAKDDPLARQRAQQTMTDDANASAQASTDMSYGGVPDSGSMSGARLRTGKTCGPRSQCDLYFGE